MIAILRKEAKSNGEDKGKVDANLIPIDNPNAQRLIFKDDVI